MVYSHKNIRKTNIPSCKNCVYYTASNYGHDFASSLSKCSNFGSKDILTDKVSFDYADECRKDESRCGEYGKYFEKENNLELKIFKYILMKNLVNNILTLSVIISIIISLYNTNKIP